MILIGSELIESFAPVLLVFAGILLFSSYKLLFKGGEGDEEEDMNNNSIVRFCRHANPGTEQLLGIAYTKAADVHIPTCLSESRMDSVV